MTAGFKLALSSDLLLTALGVPALPESSPARQLQALSTTREDSVPASQPTPAPRLTRPRDIKNARFGSVSASAKRNRPGSTLGRIKEIGLKSALNSGTGQERNKNILKRSAYYALRSASHWSIECSGPMGQTCSFVGLPEIIEYR